MSPASSASSISTSLAAPPPPAPPSPHPPPVRQASPPPPALHVLDWGRTAYAEASSAQAALAARRLAGEVPDTLVFTEHEPVFTLGLRAGTERHLLWTDPELVAHGITLAKTNRGGDITYHGPGQLVGYPIVSLAPRPDLHAYLRLLEEVLITTVASYGLQASRREGLTGIWVGRRKLAALGVSVRRWVTSHGFALNVNNDLRPFTGIVPCGIAPAEGGVTSLQQELGQPVDLPTLRTQLAAAFQDHWTLFITGAYLNHAPKHHE